MIGRGFKVPTDFTAPYTWVTPGTDDSIPIRWGSNLVAATNIPDSNGNLYFATDFTEPGAPGGTAYDGQAALGDSGGGMFTFKGGQWVLAGGLGFVNDGALDEDSEANPAGYGDISFGSDIFLSRNDIGNTTGPHARAVGFLSFPGIRLPPHAPQTISHPRH